MGALAVGLVVLLGFALRLLRLAHLGDLEFDEIVSVRYAALPAGELLPHLSGALFEHPPAFYLALGWWRALLGPGDNLARLFSIFPGTLTIPLAYAVGRRLLDRRTGMLAALLVAVAPLPVFYSREARMYALTGCLALASLWLLLRGLARPRRPAAWIAYAIVGALTAYVHYLGALVVAAHVIAAIAARRRAPHALRPVTYAAAAVAALALPWLVAASGTRGSLPALAGSNLPAIPAALASTWRDLAAGPESSGLLASAGGVSLLALVALGFPRGATHRVAVGATLLAGLAGVVFVLALGKPVQARYALPVAPAVYACAAVAMRRAPPALWLGGAGLLAGTLPFWMHYYVDYQRADYSDITARIAALERPGDAVLLTGPWQAWYFDYYYRGRLDHLVLPRDAPPALRPEEAAPQLESLQEQQRRLWFVQAGLAQADPTNFVERWLQRHAWPASREAHQNAVLSLYALEAPRVTRPLRPATLGQTVRLAGGWVDGDEVPCGDVVRVLLEFELLRPVAVNYKASLRLVGSDGQRTSVDFDLLDRSGDPESPTSTWPPGRRVAIRRGIWAPATLGPQPYEVRLVVYDPATLAPLAPDEPAGGAAEAGGEAPIGDVYVTQSLASLPANAETAYVPVGRRFGGGDDFDTIHLAGLRWGQRNPSAGPLTFDLLWRLEGFSGTEHRSRVALVDSRGEVWLEETRPLFGGTFPPHDWRDQETLAERRAADASRLPAGRYRLVVGLEDTWGRLLPVQDRAGMVELAQFDIPYRRPWQERLAGALNRLRRAGR